MATLWLVPGPQKGTEKWHKVAAFGGFLCHFAMLGIDPEPPLSCVQAELWSSDRKPLILQNLYRLTLPDSSPARARETAVSDRSGNRGTNGAPMPSARDMPWKVAPGHAPVTGNPASKRILRSSRTVKPAAAMMLETFAPLAVLSPGPRLAGTPSRGRKMWQVARVRTGDHEIQLLILILILLLLVIFFLIVIFLLILIFFPVYRRGARRRLFPPQSQVDAKMGCGSWKCSPTVALFGANGAF